MTQYVDGNTKSFTAGAAIEKHARVKIASGVLAVAVAGVTDAVKEIGQVVDETFANGDIVAVRLRSASGTCKMVAGAAIAIDVPVYGAVAGRIDDVASGAAIGISLEAASAAGDVIEVLRIY